MAQAAERAERAPDLVLITLDTTRADALGPDITPRLEALGRAGVRFTRALSAAPLTLPAHASLLTGLDPFAHGLGDNGSAALAAAIPTLAERLRTAGYATVAVVGSRVLDRRFGLDRGFDVYDDRMPAERTGEYGHAERSAAAVVDAALDALAAVSPDRPSFLWVHFFDPHAPYDAPGEGERERYLGEVAVVDAAVARLLDALRPGRRLIAVVGDHGEAFGEHGEVGHGSLLHQPTLAVPLMLAGPGVPAGVTVGSPVATQRLASTLLALAGVREKDWLGPPLPLSNHSVDGEEILHRTDLPASAYGWSGLAGITQGHWRWVQGARGELFDLVADPEETTDLTDRQRRRAHELRRELESARRRGPVAAPARAHDPTLAEQLRSLGYLAGSRRGAGGRDPRDGMALLAEWRQLRAEAERGADPAGVAERLAALVRASPESVPFRAEHAAALRAAGRLDEARGALDAALRLDPRNEFLLLQLGELERAAGRIEPAELALRAAVTASPRFARAWLALGELLARSGRGGEERAALEAAVAAETESAIVHARLAELDLDADDLAGADRHAARAAELLPEWPAGWLVWAEVARRQGRPDLAAARAATAARLRR